MNETRTSPALELDGRVADDGAERTPGYIVGVGASAGGLEALERLFEQMPLDTGLAFVVVQHLSPDFKSLTDDILARKTRIPIFRVENGMAVKPDAIFLIPPKKDMIVSGGKLLLSDKDPAQLVALPIDHFFRSLAQDAGNRAVAIVLSGTGSDGSRGVRDVRDAGGLVVVQSPDTAKFDGMPRSALDTGVVDLTLAPEEVPDALLRHARHPQAKPEPAVDAPAGVKAIFRLLRDGYGIDFSHYKPETVSRRLERRLALNRTDVMEDYAERLAADPAELNLLYKDLLIGVTRFFRDEEAFDRLSRDVLPGLIERLPPGEEFRVWVAGCATGEEAYSLAMVVHEAFEKLGRPISAKIFATDAHRASLDFAGAGIYPEAAAGDVGQARLERFFNRTMTGWQVSAELRRTVVFASHNVLRDAPFTRLDLVTCRNMLIYFQPPAQKRVLSLFHFSLKTGGVLFLGPSETPGDVGDEFTTLDPRWKFYRKRRDVLISPDLRSASMSASTSGLRPVVGIQAASTPDTGLAGAYDALLDEFMPPALLVNESGQVVQSFGGASRYLKLREGRITTGLLEVVDPELRMALTGALPRAFKEAAPVTYKGLRVHPPEGEQVVNVCVRPVRGRRGGVGHVLVQLEEVGVRGEAPPKSEEIDLGQASREQVLSLESELRYTKENLQAMIEEMETSNEELQAANEELVAANEELQSTNEELHSVNEELYTVNGEYQKKIAELTELSADMDGLLTSTEVHTIFLDRELRIRKFTPRMGETFNLLPQDVGRRIDHFTYTVDHPNLLDDLEAVLREGKVVQKQVRDRKGNWFLLRILPYRRAGAVQGVVLTLIDIAQLKSVEAEAQRASERFAAVLRNSPNWVFVKDFEGKYLLVDDAFKRAVGCDPVGKTAHQLFPKNVADRIVQGDERVARDGAVDQAEVVIPQSDGPHTYLSVKFPLRDEAGRITGLGGIKTDVTPIRQAERQAREAVAQRDRFLAMLSHELRNPLAAVLYAAEMASKPGMQPQQAGECLRIIERRSRHMARLLDDLLDVARFTQNKVELKRTLVDLREVVPDVLEEVRPWFDEAKLTLTVERPEDPLYVHGDAGRLLQAQVNLLRNAAKYTPAGGKVQLVLERLGSEAVIRVRDTGVGLAPVFLARVFDPFVQADETLDRAGGGIGVGLTLVRAIAEQHGGRVEAHSDGPGKGAEFVILLPLAPRPEHAVGRPEYTASRGRPESTPPPPPRPRPVRILVVEDDPDIRGSLTGLLTIDGHQVRAVGDGLAALKALDESPADVVLIDIGLPGISGYELVRRIRAREGKKLPYLVALTGYGRPEDRTATAAAGFEAHLTKPFRPDELSAVLASAAEGPAPYRRPGSRERSG